MDATKLWAGLTKHRRHWGLLVPALLLFAAGWQTGRIMSPYYAAQPIIFEDSAASGGSIPELQALQDAGRSQPGRGEVAGTVQPSPSNPPPPAGVTVEKRFVGSVNSDLFHDPSCAAASRIKEENQIWFTSVDEAQAAGYSPSKCTQDLLPL